MSDLFLGFALSNMIGFILGLTKPSLFFGKTRKRNVLISISMTLISFIAFTNLYNPSLEANPWLGLLGFIIVPIYSTMVAVKEVKSFNSSRKNRLSLENLASSIPDDSMVEPQKTQTDVEDSSGNFKVTVTTQVPVEENPSATRVTKTFSFNIAGTSMINDKSHKIQPLLKRLAKDWLEYEDPYNGINNKDILEDYEKYDICDNVYEVDVYGYNELKFVFEPDNPYDSDAIKVIHDDIGHVGYVPKDKNKRLKKIIDKNDYEITWNLVGGKYKYFDEDEYKVNTKSLTYGIYVQVNY